ncbi:MAG TPA: DUF5666 domain-containing protein [Thermoanaerobaculia bacterium]|jgi:hypothetical protein
MRKTTVFLAAVVVIASLLSGCHGENSVTGPPMGGAALTGQIVPMADLAGSSPAGITVTCSGQVSVTDAQGRFAFASLSATSTRLTAFSTGNLNLFFSRGDGINAVGSVSSAASEVLVYLQKTQANIVATGRSKRELEGLITAISPTSITVDDASTHGPVTATINSSTVIRKGNQTLSTTDLKVGDRVHVKASVNDDGSLTAFEIMLQQSSSDNGGGQTRELEGLITAVSQTSITVNNASTGGPVTAAITANTVIRKGNTRLTTMDLKVGDRVHVKTTANADGSLTATEIMLQNPGD